MASTTLLHVIVLAQSACPPPHLIDDTLPPATLASILRACSLQAERQRALITAVKAVLSSGDAPGLAAAARAVLASAADEDALPLPPLPPPSPPPSPPSRKQLSTWHESKEDQAYAQHAQLEVVRRRLRPGKPQTVVPHTPALPDGEVRRWPVQCDPRLYRLGLPPVANCTPAGVDDETMPCGRAMHDGLINTNEQRSMVSVFERTMRNLFHQGATTSFAPEAKNAHKYMGADGLVLFNNISRRVRDAIEGDFDTKVYNAGSLLTRIWAVDKIPDDGMDVAPGHEYSGPHVDKANRASYDYSALLYLNDHCSEDEGGDAAVVCGHGEASHPTFDGGRFAWVDEDTDTLIEPRGGRLITFTGGLENLHHGQPVLKGTRYVMGFWFTCHPELQYEDEEESSESKTTHASSTTTQQLPATDTTASWALYNELSEMQRRLPPQPDDPNEPPIVPPRRLQRQQHVVGAHGEVEEDASVEEAERLAAAVEAYAQAVEDYDRV